MKITKKTESVTTRERSVTIKYENFSGERFCPNCGDLRQFMTLDEAVIISRLTAREIFRLIETDRIHFFETGAGLLLVCFESLSKMNGIRFLLSE